MSDTKIIPLRKSNEEIRQTILTNVVRMIVYRGWLSRAKEEETIHHLVTHYSDTLVYAVKLDATDDKYMIKFTGLKVTAINNAFGLKDFLNANKNRTNLVIVKKINDKVKNQILSHYPKTELFTEDDLMIDRSKHVMMFPHERIVDGLDNDAVQKFINDYCLPNKKKLPQMNHNDMAARYLNLRRGDICRILRPSETSGYSAFYRIVV